MSQASSATPPESPASSTATSAKVAGATYTRAGQDYFEKRGLKRTAGVWGLWGLAVAAVISGDSTAKRSA